MNPHIPVTSPRALSANLRVSILCVLLAGTPLVFTQTSLGQTVQPLPTATPTSGDAPTVTITPGAPSAATMEAYNAVRTPQIAVTFDASTIPTSEASRNNAASSPTVSTIKPAIINGACTLITLRPASNAKSQTARSSTANTDSPGQPAVTVVLNYSGSFAGQPVWVQMLRGGTLSATDDSGTTYDGTQGFFLTLNAEGTATFSYQAPDASGTYQVLTRFSNTMTILPFVVP